MRVRTTTLLSVFGAAAVVCGLASEAAAQSFPPDPTWVALTRFNPVSMVVEPLTDPAGDAQNSRDIVGDLAHPLAYVHRDATHQFFRLRINASSLQSATNFGPFGWGCVLDTDLDATDYEFSALVSGVSNPDEVRFWANTVQQTPNDPGDNPETLLKAYVDPLDTTPPLAAGAGYAREVSAGSIFPIGTPDADFFIDWAIEVSVMQAAGITATTPVRIACGTANNGTFLSADYSGPASLPQILSDPVICGPAGCIPQNCAGFGTSCSVGVGACAATGIVICTLAGPQCNATAGTPTTELCDNIDNDCDGTVDDGNPGSGMVCTSGLPGACSAGTTTCSAGAIQCVSNVAPGTITETCNNVDDNCDGTVDDGFNVGGICSAGVGACQAFGAFVCLANGTVSCNAVPGMPTTEVCGDAIDNNCDGAADEGCADADGDGLPDTVEVLIGTDPNDADSDDDGVPDGQEPSPGVDTDGDGLINALDPDADNDGLFDGTELGFGCGGVGTAPGSTTCIPDGDNGATTTDPLDADTDNGGVADGSEDLNLNGVVDNGETNPTSGNGGDDTTNDDTDGDGLSNGVEIFIGSDPNDADSDNDGVIDGLEPNPADDTDGDGLINVLDPDSDNDGLLDGTEMGFDCSNPDTDATQCVPDGDGGATTTSPIDADTDDGGVSDGSEDVNLNGVVDAGETDPTSGNGGDDSSNTDADGDGLSNEVEILIGSNPNDADSDNDGVSDGQEPNPSDDTDNDGTINVLDPDSDGDGLFDGTEMGRDCNGPGTDVNAGNCVPDGDGGVTVTSPVLFDTDGGGVSDGDEDVNHNGVIDSGETDPTSGNGADDMPNLDLDGDGLTNDVEIQLGSDPNDADSDNDGVIDGDEPSLDQDTDGDGLINVLDPDSDNDGLFDGTELGLPCDLPATTGDTCIADGDGGATTTDPLDNDSDDGSVPDGTEDTNHNGVVDVGESDPNNAVDDVPDMPECEVDEDCDAGQKCDPETLTCINLECTQDSDCGAAGEGKICDETFTCADGCRDGGDQCGEGLVCTFLAETQVIGSCEPIPEDDRVVAQGSGIICSIRQGDDSSTSGVWVFAAVIGLALARRRRRAA